jgi:hypothetical protein
MSIEIIQLEAKDLNKGISAPTKSLLDSILSEIS